MADFATPNGDHLNGPLKPFYQRASKAEVRFHNERIGLLTRNYWFEDLMSSRNDERLSKLESALSKKQGGNADAGNSDLVRDLQSKLQQVTAELASEHDKVAKLNSENAKLAAENAKKDYRIAHLVRSVTELDSQSK